MLALDLYAKPRRLRFQVSPRRMNLNNVTGQTDVDRVLVGAERVVPLKIARIGLVEHSRLLRSVHARTFAFATHWVQLG